MNENVILNRLVDAIRVVTAAVGRELEDGHRSAQISADDLVEALLEIVDRLDPPVGP